MLEIESKGNATIEDLIPYVTGKLGQEMLKTGGRQKGILATGQVVGLVRDIPSCKELLDRIMQQAEDIINDKVFKLE